MASLIFLSFFFYDAPPAVSCWIVQSYVAAYGEDAAVKWAKDNGYSDDQIAEVRKKCLGK